MPIRVPDNLPAIDQLVSEGVSVMAESTADRQDIRPLQIGLLNLMPNKQTTEVQFARLLGSGPLQIELTLIRLGSHVPKNTPMQHLLDFYQPWEEVIDQKFDGVVVTGAPIEKLDYSEVSYWSELKEIFEWTRSNVHSSMFVCWGAMAALKHFHRIEKQSLSSKAFGVFGHNNLAPTSEYLAGFADLVQLPVSRWTTVSAESIAAVPKLRMLLESDQVGPCLVSEPSRRNLFMLNHVEYDSASLAEEYFRDLESGAAIDVPNNYFPDDNVDLPPVNKWRSHAHLLFRNWLNSVYQSTPYLLEDIGETVIDLVGEEQPNIKHFG